VLSVDPGLLPIGLTQSAMKSADPDRAARLILRLAGGLGDRLSGWHLTVADDLDTLLARIDETKGNNLYTLPLRTEGAV
jgi:hypothetical protein